jgi:hypothetical protein
MVNNNFVMKWPNIISHKKKDAYPKSDESNVPYA